MKFGVWLQSQRQAHHWSQAELAERLAVSRQTVIALEKNQHGPSLDLAVRLSQLFQISLDQLVESVTDAGPQGRVLPSLLRPTGPTPVIWSQVGPRCVLVPIHRIEGTPFPDAVWDPNTGETLALPGARRPEQVILAGGCDPFAGWLSQVFHDYNPHLYLETVRLSSSQALRAWQDGWLHVAGTHLYDVELQRYNPDSLAAVPHLRMPYLMWEEGLLMRPDERLERLAIREPGSEAHALFQRHRNQSPAPTDIFYTHRSIMDTVAHRRGWAGVGLGPLASPLGLLFEPWALESYDLWVRWEEHSLPWVETLRSALQSPRLTSLLAGVPHVSLAQSASHVSSGLLE
jgi:DNA-binding XRE family transcriptional regulator/molybdate-binding protein